METPLDKALAAGLRDENARGDYYTRLLNTQLFLATWDTPEEPEIITSSGSEEITPVIIDNEEGRFVMLFDTEERLSDWAQREVGYVKMQGYDVLRTLGTDLSWALNIGTEHIKILTPDELQWLQENVRAEQPSQ